MLLAVPPFDSAFSSLSEYPDRLGQQHLEGYAAMIATLGVGPQASPGKSTDVYFVDRAHELGRRYRRRNGPTGG